MVLPGMNPEKISPVMIMRAWQVWAADFDFKALGSAMDCNREFAQAGSFILMVLNATWFALVSVILMAKVVL
jgi:hypothetical protein